MTQVTDEMVKVAETGLFWRNGIQALLDAKLISLPVDESSIRESVVRECIAALPPIPCSLNAFSIVEPYRDCHRALQSLLPTKDRAKELAEEYLDHATEPEGYTQRERFRDFARWLITREG